MRLRSAENLKGPIQSNEIPCSGEFQSGGYGHVTAKTFMNSNGRILPTAFDIAAAKLAFRRPPMNRSPDIDPLLLTANHETGEVRWFGLP